MIPSCPDVSMSRSLPFIPSQPGVGKVQWPWWHWG
jgi:hypothetical protein